MYRRKLPVFDDVRYLKSAKFSRYRTRARASLCALCCAQPFLQIEEETEIQRFRSFFTGLCYKKISRVLAGAVCLHPPGKGDAADECADKLKTPQAM